MDLFRKITNRIGNLLTDGSSKDETKKQQTDSVDIHVKIKKATLAVLNSLYFDNQECCRTKNIIIWIDTDKTTFNSFSNFIMELENYWMVESGYIFGNVELKRGKPDNEQDARKVELNIDSISVYIQEQEINQVKEHIVKRACISVFGNKGSMLHEKYELSSEVLEKECRKYYNIGRGEYPDIEGDSYRQNHIAIDDKNNLETNRYVSRAHARIGYAENIGFYLQVEMGGSRLSGNRTRIFRGEDKIEVENVEVKEPLHDGDLIELGKAVVLQFVETE